MNTSVERLLYLIVMIHEYMVRPSAIYYTWTSAGVMVIAQQSGGVVTDCHARVSHSTRQQGNG